MPSEPLEAIRVGIQLLNRAELFTNGNLSLANVIDIIARHALTSPNHRTVDRLYMPLTAIRGPLAYRSAAVAGIFPSFACLHLNKYGLPSLSGRSSIVL